MDCRRKQANGHALDFYCSPQCAGKYNRLAARKQKETEMSPETVRMQRLQQERVEREAAFISKNWQTMSDEQLAEALGCSICSARNKRLAFGFSRA